MRVKRVFDLKWVVAGVVVAALLGGGAYYVTGVNTVYAVHWTPRGIFDPRPNRPNEPIVELPDTVGPLKVPTPVALAGTLALVSFVLVSSTPLWRSKPSRSQPRGEA